MTTSGVTAWSLTAQTLIKKAMKELAVLPAGGEPEADELTDGIEALNGLLKSWQMQGVALGRMASSTVTTVGGVAATALPAGVRAVSGVRLYNSATSERMLFPATRSDYFSLPNKAAAGSPTMFYVDRQNAAANLYLWPVPATVATLKLDYDRMIETVTDGNQTVDIRDEYQETVWTNLALRMATMFGNSATPSQELVTRALRLEQQMLDADRPDEYVAWYDGAEW